MIFSSIFVARFLYCSEFKFIAPTTFHKIHWEKKLFKIQHQIRNREIKKTRNVYLKNADRWVGDKKISLKFIRNVEGRIPNKKSLIDW